MKYPTTQIERIRDTKHQPQNGYAYDLKTVLKELLLDDSMTAKPNTILRLQENFIKSKLEHDLKIQDKDHISNQRLIDLMIATNDKTINDWVLRLEELRQLKTIIT